MSRNRGLVLKKMHNFPSMLSEYIPSCQLHYKSLKTRNNSSFCADRPDTRHPAPGTRDRDADGRLLQFSFGLSRRRKLYTKISIFFSETPIVHTKNVTTNKSSACAEEPTIRVEDREGDARQHDADGRHLDSDY